MISIRVLMSSKMKAVHWLSEKLGESINYDRFDDERLVPSKVFGINWEIKHVGNAAIDLAYYDVTIPDEETKIEFLLAMDLQNGYGQNSIR